MKNTTRYIITQAVLDDNKQLIPLWDNRVVFEETDLYGNVITLKGGTSYDERKHRKVVDCILDVVTKNLLMGVEINFYPTKLKYAVDDIVYVKKDGKYDNILVKTKIIDIVYETYDINIETGRKLESYNISKIKASNPDISIDVDTFYAIKTWNAIYVLENGQRIDYEMYIYTINTEK